MSWQKPMAPWACIARSQTSWHICGATILIIEIRSAAALLPSLSILSAAASVSRRACSIWQRDFAMSCRMLLCSLSLRPNATRFSTRRHIHSSARCAAPTRRMQWWMRPGPSRPCATSKPRPSPRIRFDTGTRTFASSTSPWPLGECTSPNTLSGRSTFTPAALRGTMIVDCCVWRGPSKRVLPITSISSQCGW